jgi:hypothetical protein
MLFFCLLNISYSFLKMFYMNSIYLSVCFFPTVYGCKHKTWELGQSGRNVTMMWISSHVGIVGNEAAYLEAKRASSGDLIYGRPPVARDFFQMWKELCFSTGSKSGTWKILVDILTPVDWKVERNVVTNFRALWSESTLETCWDCRRWFVCLLRRAWGHQSRYL